MTEKQVEAKLVAAVKRAGGVAYKFSSPSRRGVPDRIVVLPGGRPVFVEVKRPGGKLSPLQERELRILGEQLGQPTAVVDGPEGILDILELAGK